MNKVIQLKEDNLEKYINEDKLIVFYKKDTCPACIRLIPDLYHIPDEYKVVVVDAERHMKANTFFPGGIAYYPTIAYFEKGYYVDEFKLELIREYKQKYS